MMWWIRLRYVQTLLLNSAWVEHSDRRFTPDPRKPYPDWVDVHLEYRVDSFSFIMCQLRTIIMPDQCLINWIKCFKVQAFTCTNDFSLPFVSWTRQVTFWWSWGLISALRFSTSTKSKTQRLQVPPKPKIKHTEVATSTETPRQGCHFLQTKYTLDEDPREDDESRICDYPMSSKKIFGFSLSHCTKKNTWHKYSKFLLVKPCYPILQ